MHFELTPLIVWISLWILNTHSEFQVNILTNNRGTTKCQSFRSRKRGTILTKKKYFELSPLTVWIALWIVNTYSSFQVNIFNNNRDITKPQNGTTTTTTRTTTTPRLWQYIGISPKTEELKIRAPRC